MKKKIICLLLLVSVSDLVAQDQPSVELDELIIEKTKISNQSKSQRQIILNDSVINNATGTFTDFLQKNTTMYFKENGYGMVSSPSFRGTTAQQTGVVWNGIRINSALLGLTDFNSTAFKNFDQVVVKPGGGSVLYGSGAIGGTIHLNNEFYFKTAPKHTVQLSYGSYETMSSNYKFSAGTDKLAVNAHLGFNKSANDYEWLGASRKNLNGGFYNTHLGAELSYRINKKNLIEGYFATYNDERHFSLISANQVKTKYQNNFYRNLLKWHFKTSRFLNTLYVANVQEDYKFFDQLPTDQFSGGKTSAWVIKNEGFYQVNNNFRVSAFAEMQSTIGEGIHSNLPFTKQQIFSIGALSNYQLSKKSGFEIGAKKEFANDYNDTFLFSTGWYFSTTRYQVKLNASKNYRIPTFNDLYWQPGGNLELSPETSYQIDLNNEFHLNSTRVNISSYFINLQDMIRWIPTSNGFWQAENVGKVIIYGNELYVSGEKTFNSQQIGWNANYALTIATDQHSKKQLTYTPKHKFNFELIYKYRNSAVNTAFMYIGKTYTNVSNSEELGLDSYGILSLGVQQRLTIANNPIYINIKINNIANTVYSSMPNRLMPGRNYNLQIVKKF